MGRLGKRGLGNVKASSVFRAHWWGTIMHGELNGWHSEKMTGSPRRARDLLHSASVHEVEISIAKRPLPSRLPTCPFNPLACLASWIAVTISSLPFRVEDAACSLAELSNNTPPPDLHGHVCSQASFDLLAQAAEAPLSSS